MSTHDEGAPAEYHVSISGSISAQIRMLAQAAGKAGKKKAYLDAWLAIEKRLGTNPSESGECRYRQLGGKIRNHIGAIAPVAVEFTLDEERRAVYLVKVHLLGS